MLSEARSTVVSKVMGMNEGGACGGRPPTLSGQLMAFM